MSTFELTVTIFNPGTVKLYGRGRLGREDVLMAGITSSRITMNQALRLFTGLSLPYLDMHASNESRVSITRNLTGY